MSALVSSIPSRKAVLAPAETVRSKYLVAVYRQRNAENIGKLIRENFSESAHVALWALDQPADELSAFTIGCGRGGRIALLSRCFQTLPAMSDGDWVVVSDDDVAMKLGAVDVLLDAASSVGANLAQPAHGWTSHSTYGFSYAAVFSRVRVTNFIEIGPLLAADQTGASLIFQQLQVSPMGWGVDVEWGRLSRLGQVTLAIVDSVQMKHLSRPGTAYDMAVESAALSAAMRRAGITKVRQLQKTVRRVR